ncbi:hypothetical protein HY623_03900 [Candidatus Uhrbacteria bacterium]|nr:hypothetical protein [Candidatus Uhrbacteria bacterium]
MIERIRALFNPDQQIEEPHDQDDEKERSQELLTRRKHRITQHLENIYKEQQRLEALQTASFQFREKQKYEGGFAAAQVLLGMFAVPGGMLLRRFEPHIGSIVAYQGAHMFMRGAMTFIDRVWPESRGTVEARIGKQRKRRSGAASKEPMSEISVQEKIRELSDATRTRQQEFREFRRAYVTAKSAGIIPEQSQDEARENYLQKCIIYLDALIDGQQETIEGESGPKGLTDLAKSLKEYHVGIVGHHQEHADVIGTFFATGVLLGAQHYLRGSPWTSETMAALLSGFVTLAGTMLDRKGKKEPAQSYIETIDREIEGLKRHRLETTLRVERLIRKRKKKEASEEVRRRDIDAPVVTAPSARARTLEDDQEIRKIMNAYRLAVQEIVQRATAARVLGIGQSQPSGASAAQLGDLERGALSGFLGVRLPGEMPAEAEEIEEPVLKPRVIVDGIRLPDSARNRLAPSLDELLAFIPRPELEPRLANDVLAIIPNEETRASLAQESLPLPQLVIKIANSKDVPLESFDELLRYYKDLNDAFTQHKSVKGFFDKAVLQIAGSQAIEQVKFFEVLSRAFERLEEALHDREMVFVKNLFQTKSPEEVRAYILNRFGVAHIEEGEIGAVDARRFEERLKSWRESGKRREHDLVALQRFLEVCERVVSTRALVGAKSDEKREIVQRGLRIMKISGERTFPNIEEMTEEDQARFNQELERIASGYAREKETGIPHLENPAERLQDVLGMAFITPGKMPDGSMDITAIEHDKRGETIQYGMRTVPTDAIIGSYLPAEERASWLGKNSELIRKLAEPVIANPSPETCKELFFDPATGRERVQLWRISGPGGKIYFAMMGADTIAAAKFAGIPEIPARIIEVRQPTPGMAFSADLSNHHLYRYAYLKNLYKEGFIDAVFSGANIENSNFISLSVLRTPVPWLLWFSGLSCVRISQNFERLYPGSLKRVRNRHGNRIDPSKLTDPFLFRQFAPGKESQLA